MNISSADVKKAAMSNRSALARAPEVDVADGDDIDGSELPEHREDDPAGVGAGADDADPDLFGHVSTPLLCVRM